MCRLSGTLAGGTFVFSTVLSTVRDTVLSTVPSTAPRGRAAHRRHAGRARPSHRSCSRYCPLITVLSSTVLRGHEAHQRCARSSLPGQERVPTPLAPPLPPSYHHLHRRPLVRPRRAVRCRRGAAYRRAATRGTPGVRLRWPITRVGWRATILVYPQPTGWAGALTAQERALLPIPFSTPFPWRCPLP